MNPNFTHEFSDLLFFMSSLCDSLLILGDFNIHICCPCKPLVKEFLNTVDSFNLTQLISDPTHQKGHTLDLILSSGLPHSLLDIADCGISDHFLITFKSVLILPSSHPAQTQRLARTIHSTQPQSSQTC